VPSHLPVDLIGREREFEVAHSRLDALLRGAAGVVVLEGEAGIGKTALAEWYAASATRSGVLVASGAGRPFERNRPFGALVEALDVGRRSADEARARIGALLMHEPSAGNTASSASGGDTRFQIVDEFTDLLETMCAEAPLLLVLEDLHWADGATLDALAAIMLRLMHVPLLVVATARPAPWSSQLDMLWETARSVGADLCRLQPLSAPQMEALVQRQLGGRVGTLLNSIVQRSGGNPLLLVELLGSLVAEGWLMRDTDVVEASGDELPSTLRELVLRRMHYLPVGTLELLQLASVLGDAASIRDLAAVAGRDPAQVIEQLSEAFRGKLLVEEDRNVVFRHQLVQQAIYEDLPTSVRKALHRRAADLLAKADADLAKVASQLLLGAEPGDLDAVRWLRQAAVAALPSAPSVAVDLLQRVVELLPADHDDVDVVHAELASALMRAGNVADASDLAARVLDRPHRSDVDLALHLTLVDALGPQNRPLELIGRANAALGIPSLGRADQALLLTQASYGQIFAGDSVAGEETAARALAVAEADGHVEMICWGLCALTVAVKTQGRYAEAVSIARRAAALADDPVNADARRRHPHFFLGMALVDSDAFDDARLAYARSIDDAEEAGAGLLLPEMLLQSAELRFLAGEWDDAVVELQAGLDLAARHGQRIAVPQSCAYLALIALARGDATGAKRFLARLDDRALLTEPTYGSEIVAIAASAIAEADGRERDALDVLLGVWGYDRDHGIRYWDRHLAPPLVRLALAADRRDLADDVAATLDADLRLSPDVPSLEAAARRCRGLLDADAAMMQHAAETAGRTGRLFERAGVREDAASVLHTHGETATAVSLLQEALADYEHLAATYCIARVAAALRALGVRPGTRGSRQRAQRGWDGLTASERAVSALVAEGLTNREVARRLHVSPHTVNTHLRHVFQKLSVTTRAELAAKVVTAQITHPSDVSG
jgi:DNA-binding CsgD family transcriptional regulator/tetratricopeptide (TPR) repeat protein